MITYPFGFFGGGFDPAASDFINAAGITDTTQRQAINTMVKELKAAGLWSSFDIIYPFVGGTASQHKYNLINPQDTDAAFRAVFNGTWTHSTNGIKSGASIANWVDTKYNTNSDMTSTNMHVSAYVNQVDVGAGGYICGTGKESPNEANFYLNWAALRIGSTDYSFENGGSYNPVPGGTPNTINPITTISNGAFLVGSTTSSSNTRLFSAYDSTAFAQVGSTSTQAPSGGPIVNLAIGVTRLIDTDDQVTNAFYGSHRIAFFSVGTGLSSSQAETFYEIVNDFQTTLGRNW